MLAECYDSCDFCEPPDSFDKLADVAIGFVIVISIGIVIGASEMDWIEAKTGRRVAARPLTAYQSMMQDSMPSRAEWIGALLLVAIPGCLVVAISSGAHERWGRAEKALGWICGRLDCGGASCGRS